MSKKKRAQTPNGQGARALAICRRFVPAVESVEDATEPMEIEVTKTDAASKAVKSHKACAMAVACVRKFHLQDVIISRRVAYLIRRNVATRYMLPERITREVVAFDRGGAFAPGEYTLNPPVATSRLDHPRQTQDRGSPHRGSGPRGRAHRLTADVRAVLAPTKRD